MTPPPPVCRLCGSTAIEPRGRKRGEFIPREFDFYACRDCGLMWVEPFSGFEIYNDAYYRGAGPDPYVDYETEYRDWRASDREPEFADMARLAEDYLAATPPIAPIEWLDFGCGAGGFLKYLRERGGFRGRALRLTGHDVGSYADLLKRTDGFRILDFTEVTREPDARYEVISMIEVIEHLPDPVAALTLISRLLKPGGLLLLTTGNLASPAARALGIRYRYCAPEIHVSLFNPHALTELYRRVGLAPHAVRYRGAVEFKVLKTLRHRPFLRGLARLALRFPPVVSWIDRRYGVSAMPCAVKPALKA